MGLINKIFSGISAFFGSLFGVASKLFGIGKSEYYLELEESKTDSLPETAKSVAKATAASAGAVVDAITSDTIASDGKEPALATAGGGKGDRLAKNKAPAKNQASKNGKQVRASKGQPDQASKAQPTKAEPSSAQSKPQRPLSSEEIIAQAIARAPKSAYQDNSHAAEQTFATDYLVTPSNTKRRRPGPSLSPFKQMAKDVGK